jgi:hypothetical protein
MDSACSKIKYLLARICLAGFVVGLVGFVGCGGPVDIPIDNCGSVMIETTSADANSTVTEFVTSDCRIVGVEPGATAGTFVITIDIAEDDGSTPKPRVLFTLQVAAQELPLGTPISLSREGINLETSLPPAVYQEVDPEQEAAGETTIGPFWSSTGGSISFAEQADTTLLGTFNFTADNPSAVDNTALGTISVQGTATLNNILTFDTPCGMQSVPIGMVTLMGLFLVRFGMRRRPRR